ncbi:hypothetical protein ACOYR1_10525 [Thalassotalea piscium]
MDRVKNYIFLVVLGLIFVYFSITIIGYGVAIAIPANILEPLAKSIPSLAFALIDLITLGVPLVIFYILLVQLSKLLKANDNPLAYVYLVLPFYFLHLYSYIITFPNSEVVFYLASTLPKYVLLGLCVWYLSKQRLKKV